MSSYVDFWQGYMAGSDAERKAFMLDGLEKSIETVQGFVALDGNADTTFEPTDEDIEDYLDEVSDAYDANPDNIFAEQYFITLYGGATEAWNYYRMTGYPNTLSPNWEANPGPFPLSLLYPQNEVITNPNLTQKTSQEEVVWWNEGNINQGPARY